MFWRAEEGEAWAVSVNRRRACVKVRTSWQGTVGFADDKVSRNEERGAVAGHARTTEPNQRKGQAERDEPDEPAQRTLHVRSERLKRRSSLRALFLSHKRRKSSVRLRVETALRALDSD